MNRYGCPFRIGPAFRALHISRAETYGACFAPYSNHRAYEAVGGIVGIVRIVRIVRIVPIAEKTGP